MPFDPGRDTYETAYGDFAEVRQTFQILFGRMVDPVDVYDESGTKHKVNSSSNSSTVIRVPLVININALILARSPHLQVVHPLDPYSSVSTDLLAWLLTSVDGIWPCQDLTFLTTYLRSLWVAKPGQAMKCFRPVCLPDFTPHSPPDGDGPPTPTESQGGPNTAPRPPLWGSEDHFGGSNLNDPSTINPNPGPTGGMDVDENGILRMLRKLSFGGVSNRKTSSPTKSRVKLPSFHRAARNA